MIPALQEAAQAVSSSIGLPAASAPQPGDVATSIEQFASQFATETSAVLAAIDSAVIEIIRVAYLTCLIVGVLLYFSHLGRRLGKDLIVGGVLLLVMAQFILPALSNLAI